MRAVPLIGLAMMAAPAGATVVAAGDHGFEVSSSVNLVVPQQQAFEAFGAVGQWWNGEHSYSGDGKRMSLALRPGGCLCEPLDGGGGVEHLRITYLQPGERIVMTGSLGPLLNEATTGVMDIRFDRIAGGTRVTMNYRVAGFANGGAAEMAGPVDRVLADQLKRYRMFAAGGAPKR